MDPIKTLFVGGYADGKWMKISPETTCVRVPFKVPYTASEWEEEAYFERVLAEGPQGKLRIFVSESLSDAEAIELLLRTYRPIPLSAADTKDLCM